MNRVWLKWEPAVLGQRRKRRWSLRAPGGRKGAWLSGIRVRTWQNGKSVWSEKIQCGRKKDHLRQMSSFPTSTQQDWTIPSVSHKKSLVSLFLELGRITDGSLVSTLPSVISIGFALPSKKSKKVTFKRNSSCHSELQLDSSQIVLHSFNQLLHTYYLQGLVLCSVPSIVL